MKLNNLYINNMDMDISSTSSLQFHDKSNLTNLNERNNIQP